MRLTTKGTDLAVALAAISSEYINRSAEPTEEYLSAHLGEIRAAAQHVGGLFQRAGLGNERVYVGVLGVLLDQDISREELTLAVAMNGYLIPAVEAGIDTMVAAGVVEA